MFQDVSGCFGNVSRCFRLFQAVSLCLGMIPAVSGCFGVFQNVSGCQEALGSSLESSPAACHLPVT